MLKNEGGMLLLKYTVGEWPPSKDKPEEMKSLCAFHDYITMMEEAIFDMNRLFMPRLERS